MKRLELTLAASPVGVLDLAPLTPARLAGKSREQVRRLRLRQGSRTTALGDLFAVNGESGGVLALRGLTTLCHHVGQGLEDGVLEVSGSAGHGLGAGMRGGEIRVRGSAGDGVGAGMRGGLIRLQGDAGARLGGVLPGATTGMNGGTILVTGDVGARAGERMRRGLVVVSGACGPFLGDRMVAGTLIVLGACGDDAGLGMRRGTLLLARPPARLPATFNPCGRFELGFLPLLARHLGGIERRLARALDEFRWSERWCGDMAHGGTGEILVAVPGRRAA